MTQNIFLQIEKLIESNKIDEAQKELSKLGSQYHKNDEYLFLRSKIFYHNKLYYLAIDTLLIALEFGKNEKVYNLLAEIYGKLENKDLSDRIGNTETRTKAINEIKDLLTGLYRKKK